MCLYVGGLSLNTEHYVSQYVLYLVAAGFRAAPVCCSAPVKHWIESKHHYTEARKVFLVARLHIDCVYRS